MTQTFFNQVSSKQHSHDEKGAKSVMRRPSVPHLLIAFLQPCSCFSLPVVLKATGLAYIECHTVCCHSVDLIHRLLDVNLF